MNKHVFATCLLLGALVYMSHECSKLEKKLALTTAQRDIYEICCKGYQAILDKRTDEKKES